jgi:hypothetical protein
MSCVDVRERWRDLPERARSLLTVRAAISSAILAGGAASLGALLDVLVLPGALGALLDSARRHIGHPSFRSVAGIPARSAHHTGPLCTSDRYQLRFPYFGVRPWIGAIAVPADAFGGVG